MKKIRIGGKHAKGKNKYAIVDDEDYERLSKMKWHCAHSYNKFYAVRNRPKKFMHRIILNYDGPLVTDHINGNGLDNRKENLRIVTNAENVVNCGKYSNNKTGLKGVFFLKKRKKYRSQIVRNGKRYELGYYETKELAGSAYREKEKELANTVGQHH